MDEQFVLQKIQYFDINDVIYESNRVLDGEIIYETNRIKNLKLIKTE